MKNQVEKRLRVVEDALIKMGNDIGWIKKMGYFVVGSPVATEIIRHIWK